jgi:hypothetical protein
MNTLTKELLHELFYYKEGSLYWKNYKNNRKMNKPVGTLNSSKRLTIHIYGKSYLVHRLIYLYHHGYLPEFVDHVDNNPLNNIIENLRPASRSENNRNCTVRKDSATGVKGVYPRKNKFVAHIRVDGKLTYLGIYSTIQEAKKIVEEARIKHHGKFARHE